MGLLKKAIASRFPENLLLPLAPPFCPVGDKESNGKVPAQFHGKGGWWPIAKWEQGVSTVLQEHADAAGCNVGLILGKNASTLDGSKLAVVDIDLDNDNPEMIKLCHAIERALAAKVASLNHDLQSARYVCWIRKTFSHRAAILVRLPADQPAGRKFILKLDRVESMTGEVVQSIANCKIEFLTEGQQCFIGGKHYSGEDVKWYRSDMPAEYRPLPILTPETVPLFANWESVIDLTKEALLDAFADPSHPFNDISFIGKDKARLYAPEADLSTVTPKDLKAPSARSLIALLNLMPNPPQVTRDDYISIMMAIAGARWGLAMSKELTLEDEEDIAGAAAGWAARWESSDASSFEDELAKWHADWRRKDLYYSGWRHLTQHAAILGANLSDILLETAQEAFEADGSDELDMAFYWDEAPKFLTVDKNIYSEYWFASKFLERSGGRLYYIPEEKRWIAWSNQSGGWFAQHAHNWARVRIQEFLNSLMLQTQGIPVDQVRQVLSAAKFSNIERIVSDRVTFPRDRLNHAPWFLQTPAGAYDLRSFEKVPAVVQRANMDVRYTNYAPREGKTPYWDSLLTTLCDENPDTVEWLKCYLAYAMLGEPATHKFVYIWGTGQNGKSTLLHIMKELMGDYAGSIDRDVWLARGADKHPASLYKLRGLRLAMTSEMPPNEVWNESRLKAVTGCDEVEARPLHAQPQTFSPTAALIMVGQNIPLFKKIDNSIVRRVCIIGTAQSPRKADPQLGQRILKQEGSAIMHDLMRRCKAIHETGVYLPPLTASMQSEVKEYFDQTDSFFAWADSELVRDETAANTIVPVSSLISRYTSYYKRLYQNDPMAQMVATDINSFCASLRRLGIRTKDFAGKPISIDGEMGVQGCRLKIAMVA